MPHAFLGRFANPSTLKEISPENLLLFFDPFRGYLTKRDYELPSNPSEQIDYEALAAILANPDGEFPRDLAQRLYLVHEMATDRGMQDLLEAAPPGLLTVDGRDSTAADVALQVLLRDRALLERTHAEQFLIRTRSFYVCRGPGKANDSLPDCSGAVTDAISPELDEWFDKHGRGRGSKVFTFLRPAEDEVWFLVRHGQPMRRQGTLDEGESSSVFFRPEVFDVVIYHRLLDSLIVHTDLKGVRELYRKTFGKRVFRNEDYFSADGNYTLQPLKDKRAGALDCEDIEEISSVTLQELEIFVGKARGIFHSIKGDDVFAYLAESRTRVPKGFWNKAVLRIVFSDTLKPRTVTIWPPSRTSYTRDDDRLPVEELLRTNGFVLGSREAEDEEAEEVLGGTGRQASAPRRQARAAKSSRK